MNLSASSFFAAVIFGAAGLYVFREGRRRNNLYSISIGLGLMIYSWFTPSPLADWLIGAALCGAAYYFWDKG